MSESLKFLLQAGLEELYWFSPDRKAQWLESVYRDALYAYFTADAAAMSAAIAEFDRPPGPVGELLLARDLAVLRKLLRERPEWGAIEAHLTVLQNHRTSNLHWDAERAFLRATAFEKYERLPQAQDAYLQASQKLESAGLRRKALKALLNYVVMESWNEPENKRLIPDYSSVLNQAIRLRERVVAGLCILNISWEWERLGALELALRYARHAVRFLEKDFGAANFHHALVHRAHLYFRLGRLPEMRADLAIAEASSSTEIQCAVSLLRCLSDPAIPKEAIRTRFESSALPAAWKERLDWSLDPTRGALLSDHESRVITWISIRPRTSKELIELLYGEGIQAHSARQRFDHLLIRLKKKLPEGILFHRDGAYHLMDVQPLLMRKSA